MRVELHHGNYIVCGHIFPKEALKVGQKWQSSGGHIVEILEINMYDDTTWVSYYNDKMKHEKDQFSFQCKYCMIVDKDYEVE
jgi:hypothetical protein